MENPTPVQMSAELPRLLGLDLAPPHALVESKSCYSVIFNMLGIGRAGIGIDIDVEKREVTVLARKDRENYQGGFFWVFGAPIDARLSEMVTRYKGGALEIVIPRYSCLSAKTA